jgi:hypothetical protein
LKPRQAPFGEDEPAGIVSERDHTEKSNEQGQWGGSKRKRGTGDCNRRDSGGEQQAATAAKRTELRDEPKPAFGVANNHAREEWQPHADMLSVIHYDVVEALQLVAEKVEIGIEGIH